MVWIQPPASTVKRRRPAIVCATKRIGGTLKLIADAGIQRDLRASGKAPTFRAQSGRSLSASPSCCIELAEQPQGGDKKLHRPYACAASLRKTSHRPPQAASAREAGKNLRGESYEPSFSECFSADCSSFLGRQLQPALEDPQVGRPSQGRMKRVRTNQPAAKARKVKRFDMVAPAFVASSKK